MIMYTLTSEGSFKGINKDYGDAEKLAGIASGIRSRVRLSQEKPPVCHKENPWIIVEASAYKAGGQVVFEASKPNEKGILVFVKTSAVQFAMNGTWEFLSGAEGTVIKKATVRRMPIGKPAVDNLTWMEALIVLEPGQGITVCDQAGRKRIFIVQEDGQVADRAP